MVPNPILLIIVVFAGHRDLPPLEAAQNAARSQQAAYYRVAPRHRLMVGAVYIGLIVLLALGMHEAHVLSTGGAQLQLDLAPRGLARASDARSMSRLVSRSRIVWRLS